MKHSAAVQDGRLIFAVKDTRKWYEHIAFVSHSPKITVFLPETQYGAISAKTTTGKINLENLSFDALELSTTTGRITASNVICMGDANIQVNTGNTNLTNITCQNLIADSDTDNISLSNVIAAEKFCGETDTGNVKFDRSDAAEILAETDTGNVTGTLLTEKIFIVRTDTSRIDVPETTKGRKCKITTDTGSIKLEIKKKDRKEFLPVFHFI